MKKIFIVLVDISGYTRFIKLHKMSLCHAEGIIGELLESVIETSEFPLIAHELEGDAVSFYAASDGSSEMAKDIAQQILRLFNAFKVKEAQIKAHSLEFIAHSKNDLMWFNSNGHFAKPNKYDSEVIHETKTHQNRFY